MIKVHKNVPSSDKEKVAYGEWVVYAHMVIVVLKLPCCYANGVAVSDNPWRDIVSHRTWGSDVVIVCAVYVRVKVLQ